MSSPFAAYQLPALAWRKSLIRSGTHPMRDATRNFTFATGVTIASTSYPVATADFNGDGKAGLEVSYLTDNSFRIAIFLGKGNGTFAGPQVIAGSSPDCLAQQAGSNPGTGNR